MKTPRTLKKVRGLGYRGYTATYQTADGRFVATGGIGNTMGSTYNWSVRDTKEDRHYKARTLEECREIVRDVLDEEGV